MKDLGSFLAHPLFQKLGWTLAVFLWQGTLVAAFLASIDVLLRRHRPEVRYVAACGALLLMVSLPIATFANKDAGPAAFERVAGSGALDSTAGRSPSGPPALGAERSPAAAAARAARATVSSLGPWLVPAWIAGVLFLSFRFLAGWAATRVLARRGVAEVPEAVRATLARVAERVRLTRPVLLLQSAAVAVPTALGTLRPMILLPVAALTGLSPEALEAVLAHELAHIRRHDYLINLLQTAAETLLFYHPGVWWVSHRIRVERENCCDDLAVRATGDARAYARALVGLEEMRSALPRLAVAATGGTLWNRVQRLLPAPPSPAEGASRWLAAVLALATVGTLGLAARISGIADASADGSGFVRLPSPVAQSLALDSAADSRPRLGGVTGGVAGGVAGGVSGAVRGGVSGGVGGGVVNGVIEGPEDDTAAEAPEESSLKESQAGAGRASPDDLAALMRHGVTPEFLGSLAALGYKQATVDDLLALRIHGVTPEFISAMNGFFGKLSPDELVSLKIHGVTPDFVRAMRTLGYPKLSADEAVSARIHGVTLEFAKEIQSLGYKSVTLDELTSLRIHGVTPELIRKANGSGSARLSIDELLDLRIHGRNK